MAKNRAAIFLKGTPPIFKLVKKLLRKDTLLIAADGASTYLAKAKLNPDVIIGDMDSSKPDVLRKFSRLGSEIITITDQDTTDFEKSLLYCKAHKIKEILVFGALSMRADHTLNNFSVLKRYSRYADIKIYDKEFEIFFINHEHTFKYKKGEVVSFLAMPLAASVVTKGLEFPLKGEDLEFGVREGTLNRASASVVKISYTKGDLLLFKKHFIKH